MWAQVKAAQAWIAAVLLVASFVCGLFLGAKWSSANGAHRAVTLMADQLDAVKKEQAEDRKRAKKLQDTLDKLPKSEGKIREIVRENPSKCDRPAAVSERVREAVREANAAREMPSDF